jgi:benzylsuccinate CoA-transferase BbsE subunit
MLLAGTLIVDATDRFGWLAGRVLADLGGEVVKLDAPGTDRSSAEWRAFNVNKRALDLDPTQLADNTQLTDLLTKADICLVTPDVSAPGGPFDADALHARYPRLVVVAITPFGRVGPRSGWRATDIEMMASGGAMFLAGEPNGTPLRISEPQANGWVGAQAATGALVALYQREVSGKGDLVDVSAQSAVVSAIAHAPAFYDMLGVEPKRAGAFMTGRSIQGARYRVFWPCQDGWLNFIFYGGVAGRRTNEQLVGWMRERGAELGPLAQIDWVRWDPTKADQAEIDSIEVPVMKFFAGVTKREFLTEAHRREMLGYPVSTVADIATDPQLEARAFFETIAAPNGARETYCGSFALIDGARPPLRYARGVPLEPTVKTRA